MNSTRGTVELKRHIPLNTIHPNNDFNALFYEKINKYVLQIKLELYAKCIYFIFTCFRISIKII